MLKRLIIEGFRSFQDRQVLDFPEGPGLYRMTGENIVEPALGANGAGKTSVWAALSWALTGKTDRGQKGPAVRNRNGAKRCCVDLTMKARNGADYEISRSHKPNNLTIGDRVVDQAELEDLTGLPHSLLCCSVLMGQFGRFFFDLQPTEKLNLFSEILDLSLWIDASKRASKALKVCDDHIRQLEQRKAGADARVGVLEERIEELRQKAASFETDRETKLSNLEADLQELEEQKTDREIDLKKAAKRTSRLDKARKKLGRQVEVLEVEVRNLRKEVPRKTRDFDQLVSQLADLEEKKAKASESICPACLQEIPPQRRRQMKKKIIDEIQRVEKLAEEADSSEAERMLEDKESELADLIQKEREARAQWEASRDLESKKRDRVSKIIADIKTVLDKLKELESDTNPHEAYRKQTEEQLKESRADLKTITNKLRDERLVLDALSFWPKGFKDVRLWIIEQALLDLEVATNNSLTELGMHGWRVTFDVERETKAGGVSRGFTVLIHPPDGDPLPWESWSGGETQRLRIAGAAALADLIRARSGAKLDLEVWDEPTAHLSDEGVEDLLAWFQERARDRQIWLVDHRSLDAGAFEGTACVAKDADGSHIGPVGV